MGTKDARSANLAVDFRVGTAFHRQARAQNESTESALDFQKHDSVESHRETS